MLEHIGKTVVFESVEYIIEGELLSYNEETDQALVRDSEGKVLVNCDLFDFYVECKHADHPEACDYCSRYA